MLSELEKIDWLVLGETSDVAEEDLDRPYAYLDRIYTRREFEKTAEEGCTLYSACQKKRAEKRAADVKLFFDNIDMLMQHREEIYADKELAGSNPLGFERLRKLILGMYDGYSLTLEGMLRLWANGAWKGKCPECETESYLFRYGLFGAFIWCPKCGKVQELHCTELLRVDPESTAACKIFCEYEGIQKKYGVQTGGGFTLQGRSGPMISFSAAQKEKTEQKKSKNKKKKETLSGFKEFAESTREYSELPREEVIGRARFEMAKKHGKLIAEILEDIAEMKAFLADETPSETQKFFAGLNEKIKQN